MTEHQSSQVTVVRIYLSEHEAHLDKLLDVLKGFEKISGVTVFRGIAGFGDSGKLHSSSLVDLSLDLPVVVEFFDQPEKAQAVIKNLQELGQPGHIISWNASLTETGR